MSPPDADIGGFVPRDDIGRACEAAWARLAEPGSWWTGAQRVALASIARTERTQRSDAPWQREKFDGESEGLSPSAIEVARLVAADAHRIDREWAQRVASELGDAAYVEIVGMVACLTAMDAFAEALGVDPEPLPAPRSGEPDHARPEGLSDIGAYVEMIDPFPGPNVARALSLAPGELTAFFGLVSAMYAGADFGELVWNRPLTRPQVELIAARVSSLNECFY